MQRDRQYLLDIVESARLARIYISSKSRDEFEMDTQCQDAVIRRLVVMGEAARRLSDEAKAELPGIPWQAITGMQNFVIHEYDVVDTQVIWDTVKSDLPAVVAGLEPLVPPDRSDSL